MSAQTDLVTFEIPAKPTGIWTLVNEFVEGSRVLKISANETTWTYADAASARCGADGHRNAFLAHENCLFPDAPVGALIGKIGGSSAGIKDGTKVFVVGRFCVVTVPEEGGPLYLTINDEYSGMENNADAVKVTVVDITPPAKPKAAPSACCALLAALSKLSPCPNDAQAAVKSPD